MGKLATVLGVCLVLFALAMAAGDCRTANLDALSFKTNLVIVGAALFLGGIITDAGKRVEKAILRREAANLSQGVKSARRGVLA